MTAEEKAAVEVTRNIPAARDDCAFARRHGHALVSQGCGYYRCVNCNETGACTQGYGSNAFRSRCPNGNVSERDMPR